jgi:hypothetical protein
MPGGIGVLIGEHVEIEPPGAEFARDVLERLDLGGGEAEPSQPVGAGAADRVGIEWVERRLQSAPYRRRARGRQLLAADDVGDAGKARLPPPQRRHAGCGQDRRQPLVLRHQRADRVLEDILAVEVQGHGLLGLSPASCARA